MKQDKKGRIAIMTGTVERTYKDENDDEKTFKLRRKLWAIRQNGEKDGTPFLIPDVEIEGWWTNLSGAKDKVIERHKGHALCEMYHSEPKTDMDQIRLPAGKFAGRFIRHTHGLTLSFDCHAHDEAQAFAKTYERFAYS